MPTFSAPPPHPAINEYSEVDDQEIRLKVTQKRKDAFAVLVKTVVGWGYTGVGGFGLLTSVLLKSWQQRTSRLVLLLPKRS